MFTASTDLDRVELLLQLIQKNGAEDIELFNMLVPKYDIQLYYLYNILVESDIIDGCKPKNPTIENNILSVSIHLSNKNIDKCVKYLDKKDNKVKYLKKEEYEILTVVDDKVLTLSFQKL